MNLPKTYCVPHTGSFGHPFVLKIVVYDIAQSSEDVAARIFRMLEYLGCKNVRILNGGWRKWLADGRPVEKQ